MTPCDWFETEGLPLQEQGEPLGDHLLSCADCQQAKAEYDAIQATLMRNKAEPPSGWQAAVWRRIEARRRQRALWWSGSIAALLLLAFGGAAAVQQLRPAAPALIVALRAGDEARRGPAGPALAGTIAAAPGDALTLRARRGAASHLLLRVYFNDAEAVLSCPGDPACAETREGLSARLVLDRFGRYQPVLFASDAPLETATAGLDADSARARNAGATVLFGEEATVR